MYIKTIIFTIVDVVTRYASKCFVTLRKIQKAPTTNFQFRIFDNICVIYISYNYYHLSLIIRFLIYVY